VKLKTCVPHTLPLRALDWASFADYLWRAHDTLARYDEAYKRAKNKKGFISLIASQEARWSIESRKRRGPGTLKLALKCQKALRIGGQMIKKRPFSISFFCELHGMVKKDEGKYTGKIRDSQNWIGPEGKGIKEAYFIPPTVGVMKKRMENLLFFLHSEEPDPLVKLAIGFAQFLIVHPFMDGNGRVGRAMIPLFAYRSKMTSAPILYLSRYFKKNRLTYFERLYGITTHNEWEAWIEFFMKGVISESERLRGLAAKSR